MKPIKQNQIQKQPAKNTNPYSALPRDLDYAVDILDFQVVEQTNNIDVSGNESSLLGDIDISNAAVGVDSVLTPPPVPAIISIKSQTISYGPDGKALVDVVVEVQDVDGSAEYDLRVAKSAGSI